jgi:hypothetical protein
MLSFFPLLIIRKFGCGKTKSKNAAVFAAPKKSRQARSARPHINKNDPVFFSLVWRQSKERSKKGGKVSVP